MWGDLGEMFVIVTFRKTCDNRDILLNQLIQFYSNNVATPSSLLHTVRRLSSQHRDHIVITDYCDLTMYRDKS